MQNFPVEAEEILERTSHDPEFREKFIKDPVRTIRENSKIPIPENTKITVMEESDGNYFVVLPPVANRELSDAELETVAGGKCYSSCWSSGTSNCTCQA
jgi:hypothetical protein